MYKLALFLTLVLFWGGLAQAGSYGCRHQEKVIIKGQLIQVKHPIALVAGEDGRTYRVRLGPYWFWKEKGYRLKKGAKIRIIGIKQGVLIFPIVIETEKTRLLIRDECGLPLWRHRP